MTDVLIYWRDYRKNVRDDQVHGWYSNASLIGDLLPGDRLWMVTSGKCLRQKAEQAGFLVAVWQVQQVVENADDDPAYPANEYKFHVIADEVESLNLDEPVAVDHILRPAGRDKAVSIGRFLQRPRKLSDEKVRLMRVVAGPQMAQKWLTGTTKGTVATAEENKPVTKG